MRAADAESLELARLLDAVATHAGSAAGAAACRRLPFATDAAVVRAELARVDEMLVATADAALPLGSLPDIRDAVDHARTPGVVLPGETLCAVQITLQAIHAVRGFLASRAPDGSALATALRALPRFRELADLLAGALEDDGTLRDDASPRLRALRRQLRERRVRLQERLERLVRSSGAHIFADRFVTQRNGRCVVPVRSGALGEVGGIVQDRSASGETLFVEPLAAVEANNEITLALRCEAEEQSRLLAELTAAVGAAAEPLALAFETLVDLDTLAARARYARRHRAVCPTIGGDEIHLARARHVLLEIAGREAVPIDIELPAACRLLVLSGPNAGGKSVALKTLGLAVLGAQSGIPVAAEPDCRLPCFAAVFADIGDPQSVAGDLSTFSGHVRNLGDILARASDQSLVLLDEPGTGTAPEDGAALAVAVLEHLAESGVRTLASTHFQPVKLLALRHPRARVASVDFDPETYAPRYRLLYGSVGPSLGLDVARRFGLPESLVEQAAVARGSAADLEVAIARLEDERRAHETARLAADEEERRHESSRRDFDRLIADLERRRREHWSAELLAARRFADELRHAGERLLDEAKRQPTGPGRPLIEESRRQIRSIAERARRLEPPTTAIPGGPAPGIGDLVEMSGSGVRGTLAAVDGDRAWVLQGSMRFAVATAALRRWSGPPRADTSSGGPRRGSGPRQTPLSSGQPPSAGSGRDDSPPSEAAAPERQIVLVGERVRAALARLEPFLDAALAEGLDVVRIVHGHGTGALRTAVRDYLATCPHVVEFGDEVSERAAGGATLARFR